LDDAVEIVELFLRSEMELRASPDTSCASAERSMRLRRLSVASPPLALR
tara:strand:+ start:125 stop:271 length:147 start_codon:yes stop_codon:yes gene_type:complete